MAAALGLLLVPLCNSYAAGVDTPDPFVHPPALERDVRFWIRVYTEVTTDQGLLHDDWNLGLVYEVLRFDPAASPAQRLWLLHLSQAEDVAEEAPGFHLATGRRGDLQMIEADVHPVPVYCTASMARSISPSEGPSWSVSVPLGPVTIAAWRTRMPRLRPVSS